jgi:hypothetical protein
MGKITPQAIYDYLDKKCEGLRTGLEFDKPPNIFIYDWVNCRDMADYLNQKIKEDE